MSVMVYGILQQQPKEVKPVLLGLFSETTYISAMDSYDGVTVLSVRESLA